jgi:hypothetical protein
MSAGQFSGRGNRIVLNTVVEIDSCAGSVRPWLFTYKVSSFNFSCGCSSVFMTGIRGATPPPAG